MKEGVYEFGDARVVVKRSIARDQFTLWLMYKEHVVTMDDGAMIMEKIEPGVELDEDDAFMTWEGTQDITTSIFEVFNALAVAMGGGARSADEAYERGKLEGENKILKQWNESLTGTTTTPSTPEPGRPWNDGNVFPLPQPYRFGTNTPTYSIGNSSKLTDEIDGLTDGVEDTNIDTNIQSVIDNVFKEYGQKVEENLLSQITGSAA